MVKSSPVNTFDEIDTAILRVLAENPRTPYNDIQERIEEQGYEMSTEGIRYRVSKIFEQTTLFFLLDPKELEWEILRIAAKAVDKPGAKDEAFEFISSLPFWHVSKGIGTFDLFGVGTAPTMEDIDGLVTEIKESELIESVDYLVVTERNRDMNSYLSLDYLSQ